jgi:hypothetical protein
VKSLDSKVALWPIGIIGYLIISNNISEFYVLLAVVLSVK